MWSCFAGSLFMVVVFVVIATSRSSSDLSVYTRVFHDAEMVWDDAIIPSLSWVGCSSLCRQSNCFAWTWSPEENWCSIHFHFSPTSTTYPAEPRSHTYVLQVGEAHDHLIFPVVEQTWDEARDLCLGLGAVLAYRNDKDWMMEMKALAGVPGFFVGLRRGPNITDPWYDQLGNLVQNSSIFWSVEEPSNTDMEMCSGLWTTMNDLRCDTKRDLAALCQLRK